MPRLIGISRIFVVDTSALVDMKKWYPMDAFTDLWDKIERMVKNGEIKAPMEVFREIKKKDDVLKKWCQAHKEMFVDENLEIIKNFERVKEKYDSNYWEANIQNDLWADPWVIACALSLEITVDDGIKYATIITSENTQKPNRIPVIARKFGIKSMNVPEFMSLIKGEL